MLPRKSTKKVPLRTRLGEQDVPIGFVPIEKTPPFVLEDVGPYAVWSTVLLSEVPEKSVQDQLRESERRSTGSIFFSYSVGGQVPGAYRQLQATRLETNLNVANQFVDEWMDVESIDLVIPRVSLAVYQINPSGGAYKVTEDDVASLTAMASVRFCCGGEKPFAEATLAHRPIVSMTDELRSEPTLKTILGHAGGWIVRFAEFKAMSLPIGRIEKFWGELLYLRLSPNFGRHCYNPAVIAAAMILNGERGRGVQ